MHTRHGVDPALTQKALDNDETSILVYAERNSVATLFILLDGLKNKRYSVARFANLSDFADSAEDFISNPENEDVIDTAKRLLSKATQVIMQSIDLSQQHKEWIESEHRKITAKRQRGEGEVDNTATLIKKGKDPAFNELRQRILDAWMDECEGEGYSKAFLSEFLGLTKKPN